MHCLGRAVINTAAAVATRRIRRSSLDGHCFSELGHRCGKDQVHDNDIGPLQAVLCPTYQSQYDCSFCATMLTNPI